MQQIYPTHEAEPDLAASFAFPPDGAVRAVFVSSLDGAATRDGRAGGLGSSSDRRIFALQRSLADVVLVGAGTVRIEGYGPVEPDPEWSRARGSRPSTPPIAVVSAELNLDPGAPLFVDAPEAARTIVITSQAAPADRRDALRTVADVIVAGHDEVDLDDAIEQLAERGLRQVTCEGGPTLMARLAASGRLDELCLTTSPMILAGASPRITNGPALDAAQRMQLATLLEDDGYVFALYRTRPA